MAGTTRVFISYSSKDTNIVDRLKGALSDAGVVVWLDHEQLTPGTPNWEIKVREGIAQATHIVYVASPDAALSPYVIHEIEMARGKGKTVLPFWIRGENWYDCAPMGWYRTQYTDGRDAAYSPGLATLLAALGVSAPQTAYPPPDVSPRLISLSFRGVNVAGAQAIIPPLVSVAADPILMGSDKAKDREASDSEIPQHRVELPAFQLGTYPVTVAEYALAVRAGVVREPPTAGAVTWQTQLQRLDHPVVCVSWQDATAYVAWLREVTGQRGWRLPSEAQWEKAARWDAARGVSAIYPWGDHFDPHRCNVYESGLGATNAVGSYPGGDRARSGASPCGAEEMAGNVWEWTSSLYKPYPYIATDGREDEHSTGNRTLRGGSWVSIARYARAACRDNLRWDNLISDVGFRLALSPSAGS